MPTLSTLYCVKNRFKKNIIFAFPVLQININNSNCRDRATFFYRFNFTI